MARSRKQVYAARTRSSPCRNRSSDTCIKKYGCKKTKGTRKRKSYCRKMSKRNA